MKHIKLYEEFVTEGKVVIMATGVPGEARAALTAQGHGVRTMGPGLYITVDAAKRDGVVEYLKGLGAEVSESGPLGEAVSTEAAYIHVVTGAGQDSIQDFIDDHGLDAKKFSEYVRLNQGEKYDIRDYISGAKGTVGGVPRLRQSFIKKFKIDGRRKSTT